VAEGPARGLGGQVEEGVGAGRRVGREKMNLCVEIDAVVWYDNSREE